MTPKLFSTNIYSKILKEVGPSSYLFLEPNDRITNELFPRLQELGFHAVCLSTGDTLETSLIYRDFTIPKGSEIIMQRVFRYCDHGGTIHLNADDYLYFPVKDGRILYTSRRDAPDHYMCIVSEAGLTPIAEAYQLPVEKQGPIYKYKENGALIPIKMDCVDNIGRIKIEDITGGTYM